MEPAASIIRRLGGDTAIARRLGLHRVSVARWKSAVGQRGLIPMRYVADLMKMSDEVGADLKADDFMPVGVPR